LKKVFIPTHMQQERVVFGVISDTHGELSRPAWNALAGVDGILHAGDVGKIAVLHDLERIAPVNAVRGNMDRYGPTGRLPVSQAAQVGTSSLVYVIHDLNNLDLDPAAAGFQAVVFGHTHRPSIEWRNGVLFLNPGSVSQPRAGHQPSFARITVEGDRLDAEIVYFLPK
jgi:putative phosphoesterase